MLCQFAKPIDNDGVLGINLRGVRVNRGWGCIMYDYAETSLADDGLLLRHVPCIICIVGLHRVHLKLSS